MNGPSSLPQPVPLPATSLQSWGRLHAPSKRSREVGPDAAETLASSDVPALPFGRGRSYGDVCSIRDGVLLTTGSLRRFLAFDEATGVLRAEAGVLLADVLDLAVPRGWFLPVTPGTRFVTLGGAIANDVHGKNHHGAGTFGCYVRRLEVVRSDGSRIECSPQDHPHLFRATVGGLGLTGLITWCEVQLMPVKGRAMVVESRRFANLAEFFALSGEMDRRHAYTVAWIDCLAGGAGLGRGWLMAGSHSEDDGQVRARRKRGLDFFIQPPFSLVNALSLRAFNLLYYHRPVPTRQVTDFEPFFYPLDAVGNWNRMYGPRGFYQFQCVVPPDVGERVIRELLAEIARQGQGSFLAVLKQFGTVRSPGLLSFPRPGPTLALDFPNRGTATLRLMKRLEAIAMEAGGALYPAKDACMDPDTFERSYPAWRDLEALRDPAFTSDFWRRVTADLI